MLEKEIKEAINRASAENDSNTPDSILAAYLAACLEAFNEAANRRDRWYDAVPNPGPPKEKRANDDVS